MVKLLFKSFLFLLLLVSPVLMGNNSNTLNDVTHEETTGKIYLNNWTASDNGQSGYGKGRFFYRISRSQYPIDKAGNYLFEVHFISDSYYPANSYDYNRNGVVENNEVYRASTKIDNMSLSVDNRPYNNGLTNSSNFWLLFKGNYAAGVGDLGISFKYRNPNPKIWMNWTGLKPY